MTEKKRSTVSVRNTPVRRALDRAKRSTLVILIALGFILGMAYKQYFGYDPIAEPPAAPQQQSR